MITEERERMDFCVIRLLFLPYCSQAGLDGWG